MLKSCILRLWASLFILAQTMSACSVRGDKQNFRTMNP